MSDSTQEQEDHGKSEVHITINDKPKEIHRGSQTVAKIKVVGDVPAADELEQIINGVFTPLDDNGSVTIKGNEIFVSHVRASAGS